MGKVKEKIQGDDASAIKQAIDELEQASHALSKHLYEHGPPPQATQEPKAKNEDVVDAEFEVKE